MAKEKKHSNQVNPQVSPESLGSRTQASPPPRKFLMNIQASIDCRCYRYAGLPCNAAP